MRIGIIGCGHMGSALGKAFLARGEKLYISGRHKPALAKEKSVEWTVDNRAIALSTNIIFIGVKPGMVQTVLEEIAPLLKPRHLIISIAAAVTLKKLQQWSGGHKKIVRVMPNLAAVVGESMSMWKGLPSLSKKEKNQAQKLLESFGVALEVKNENLIDATSTVAGCGPAYVAAFLESMEKMLLKNGISKKDARAIAVQTLYGTTKYFKESDMPFAVLKNAVQTKGGITEAAFKVLTKKKWQQIFEEGMQAALTKTKELMAKV